MKDLRGVYGARRVYVQIFGVFPGLGRRRQAGADRGAIQ